MRGFPTVSIKSELLKRALEDISKMLSDLIKYGASLGGDGIKIFPFG